MKVQEFIKGYTYLYCARRLYYAAATQFQILELSQENTSCIIHFTFPEELE